MKTLVFYMAALYLPLTSVATTTTDDGGVKYIADITSSEITWTGYKVLGQHNGTIDLKSGSLVFNNNVLTGGEFVIDMTSIKNLDMAGGGGAEKLEGHLKSDDFFGVSKYPTASLKITRVIPYGTNGDYKVNGDLTIKGITKPISFMTKVNEAGGLITATADIKVDRSDFDVRYGSGSFFDDLGDKAINDQFDLSITLSLNPA